MWITDLARASSSRMASGDPINATPIWSPDSSQPVFLRLVAVQFYRRSAGGGGGEEEWQVSTSGGYEPRWRADGREIYYLSEDGNLVSVAVRPGPSFEDPKPLFQTRVPRRRQRNRIHYVPSRDGQRFLVNTQSTEVRQTPITVVLNCVAGRKK
jgi:hypothetical protein